jgi:ubiquitin carboxyl-terminal hydrolase 14
MDDGSGKGHDPVQDLFGLELESKIKNSETDIEPETVVHESVMKLPCHIDNNNNPIDSLQDGLKISLNGDMEKFSEALQRNAVFSKTSKLSKLPSYLCI